ncbi:MAG TPA: exopolysaccharide biosynthesis protein [Devosia sp.]|jgi:hypothetical protein|uniref:exopolysaccharide biosynthesis protein n=1 Tax=Devosia sp. TaxID=1871048 RepID=UPI002F938D9C
MLDKTEARSEGALSRLVRKVQQRTARGEAISIGLLQEVAGVQAAAPMLLIPALIVVSPLSIVPGLPTVIGLHTAIVSAQIIAGRRQIWLPGWLRWRSLSAKHAEKLLKFLLPVSQMTDGVVRRRLLVFTRQPMRRLGAGVCLLLGAIMPLLEFIPMSSTIAAAVIAVYALGLLARDGLLTLAWWGALAIVAALGLWLAPQAIELLTGADLPALVPELEGTPLEVLDPLLPD